MKRISLRMVKTLAEEVKAIADEKGMSVNSTIIQILWEFVEKYNDKKEE